MSPVSSVSSGVSWRLLTLRRARREAEWTILVMVRAMVRAMVGRDEAAGIATGFATAVANQKVRMARVSVWGREGRSFRRGP